MFLNMTAYSALIMDGATELDMDGWRICCEVFCASCFKMSVCFIEGKWLQAICCYHNNKKWSSEKQTSNILQHLSDPGWVGLQIHDFSDIKIFLAALWDSLKKKRTCVSTHSRCLEAPANVTGLG